MAFSLDILAILLGIILGVNESVYAFALVEVEDVTVRLIVAGTVGSNCLSKLSSCGAKTRKAIEICSAAWCGA